MATDFRDLRVWDEAMALSEMVYDVTSRFPPEERYGLVAQMRRAAVSVASCIAEGNALRGKLAGNFASPFPIPQSRP